MNLSDLIKNLFGNKPENLSRDSVMPIISKLINWSFLLVGGVVLLFLIIGGYYLLTSGGNEEQVKKGKDTLKSAIMGLIVVLAAYAIVKFLLDFLTGAP